MKNRRDSPAFRERSHVTLGTLVPATLARFFTVIFCYLRHTRTATGSLAPETEVQG